MNGSIYTGVDKVRVGHPGQEDNAIGAPATVIGKIRPDELGRGERRGASKTGYGDDDEGGQSVLK